MVFRSFPPARDQEKFLCDIIAQRSMFVRSTEWLFNYEMPFMGRIDKKSKHTFEVDIVLIVEIKILLSKWCQ